MQNTLTSTCQYQFFAGGKTCKHPPLRGGRDKFCIFHSRNDKKGKGAFWEGIQDKLEAKDFDFTGYYFPPGLEADFVSTGFKDAKFIDAIFKGGVNFSVAEFSGESTNFLGAEFSGEHTGFVGAKFSGEGTSFLGAKFSGESTDFSEAEFSGKSTYFSLAKFSGESTDFRRAKFSGKSTDFIGAEFSGKNTVFSGAKFSGESTVFSGAEFSGKGTDFSWVKFLGESTCFIGADFSGCGTVRFVDTVFKGECKFLGVKFPLRSDQFAIFAGTMDPIDLGNTVFLYSNYDRLTFRNCKFIEGPDEQSRFWRRRVILKDEKFIGEKLELKKEGRGGKGAGRGAVTEVKEEEIAESVNVEFSHVESLYRQFKKNLEAEKDWELAGEFHYGEMECKRKGITSQWPLEWLRQNFGLLAFYKYFSGYGERPFRTSCWIVFLLPVFAGIYYWLDLQPRQDFGYYLWELSVKATFLQRIGEQVDKEPIGFLGKLAYLIQSVLCPTLIALFILALRRRVRR